MPRVFSLRAPGTALAAEAYRDQGENGDWRRGAFSAIELIGVLAVLVIIGALVLPRITRVANPARATEGVSQARVAEALASIQAAGTAAAEHCARFGSLASRNGVPFPVATRYDRFDEVLLSEQLLDRPFAVRLGSGATLRLVNASGLSAASRVDGTGGAYDLDGRGANGISGAAYVLEAVISGATESEAKALNDGLDGPALGADSAGEDLRGKVTYRAAPPGQPREVHIHIIHR